MEASSDGRQELERHLERQMRAQERQLAWVRLGMVLAAALLLGVSAAGRALADPARRARRRSGPGASWSRGSSAGSRRARSASSARRSTWPRSRSPSTSPARRSTLYLFYGLVILGHRPALRARRIGLVLDGHGRACTWRSCCRPRRRRRSRRQLLPVRVGYLISFGVVAGLFSRIVIGRATENARLQLRLTEEERQRERDPRARAAQPPRPRLRRIARPRDHPRRDRFGSRTAAG